MTTGRMGVAISTTGDEHRLGFLETCVNAWRRALPLGATLVVTVDGSAADTQRVRDIVDWPGNAHVGGNTVRVGRTSGCGPDHSCRMGVAVNKNTGIEYLMDDGVEHLFLCDDDTWPLFPQSLAKHIELERAAIGHSMVCWGQSRLKKVVEEPSASYAVWLWPRGVMLYTHRSVVDVVGGMVEAFGPGGHEHAEWSQRISNAGYTRAPFVSPASYATRTGKGASALWHAEDMRRPGETGAQWTARKAANTTVQHPDGHWSHVDKIMAKQEGSSTFVPYRAHENGRASATLCQNLTCAMEPAEPRSDK